MRNLYFIALIFVLACAQEDDPDIYQTTNDRLSFRNMDEFHETYLKLSELTSKEDLELWAESRGHSTLLHSEDPSVMNYSDILRTILNKDAEFELAGSIVRLDIDNGNLYAVSKNHRALSENDKGDLDGYQVIAKVEINKIGSISNKETGDARLYLGPNSLDARNQREFNQVEYGPCGTAPGPLAGRRKYVHELVDETIISSVTTYKYLYLRIKLEFRGSRRWKPAGEQREIRIDVNGTLKLGPIDFGSYAIFDVVNCSRDRTYLIKAVLGVPPGRFWNITMNGSIYQKVIGDVPTNAWNNKGTLW